MSLLQPPQEREHPRSGCDALTPPQPPPPAQELRPCLAQKQCVACVRGNGEAAAATTDQEGHTATQGTGLVDVDAVGAVGEGGGWSGDPA